MTAFADLSAAVKAALVQAPALAGGRVHRARHVVLEQGAASCIEISPVQHQAEALGMAGPALMWQTTLAVLIKVRAAAGIDAEAALDPLIGDVWQRLKDMAMPAGVRGITLAPLIRIDFEETERTVATAALALQIDHVTTTTALTA